MDYKRTLRPSEAERYFIYVEEKYREMFPQPKEPFTAIVKGKPFTVAIDTNYRIWINIFWEKLPTFKEGDTVTITKNANGTYKVDSK